MFRACPACSPEEAFADESFFGETTNNRIEPQVGDLNLAAGDWALSTLRDEARGKMVIDCGATRSLGSILALEDLAAINQQKSEPATIKVDPADNSSFKFGSGATKQTSSRASLGIVAAGRAGHVKMYALDTEKKYVPMLGSMEVLMASSAVIDFRRGVALVTELDPDRVTRLERLSSNHLAFDLTRDIYEDQVDEDEAEGVRRLQALSGPAAENQ